MLRTSLLRRERAAATSIPYTAHVSPYVIRTTSGDYVQIFKLAGASFQTADDAQLNNWHERLNILWRNIATPNVALWTHIVRRKVNASGLRTTSLRTLPLSSSFAADLGRKYQRRLETETLMTNELYLSAVYRPITGPASTVVARALGRSPRHSAVLELSDALDACSKLEQALTTALARYEPERLGIYARSSRRYSAALEFLSLLINGEALSLPLARAPLADALATTRLSFGTETIEYRSPTQTKLAAILGIKEYPTPTLVGMFDSLLSAPFEFVLTQSFTFLSKATAQGLMQRQYNRMANAGDFAVSQAEELHDALDQLTSNEFVLGDHHLTLQVLADRPELLNSNVALARTLLADTGMTVAREDLALEAAFWAQLPGNFSMRPRRAPITSRNFAAMVPFHNYPVGRADNNHWGPALVTVITSARSAFHFSLHASSASDIDGAGRKDTGHTTIFGPTGSGKTVLIAFLITRLLEQHATQIIIDKDRGLEPLANALGGEYQTLENGKPTGFNPLQLPASPQHYDFLKSWLMTLARPRDIREQVDLDQALRGTLALDAPVRRLSRLIEFLDATDPTGVHARLAPWCEATDGDYAWLFDNAEDTVLPRIDDHAVLGFDVTEFLDNAKIRTPITQYLFHLTRQLLDGRRLVCWMDEFWRLLEDPSFEAFAKDGPKTWRKLNAVMAFATQSASDVLQSPISRTLVEQTPTKVFYPNPDAREDDFIDGLGLTEREFRLIKEQLEPGSRQFLLKQNHTSVVCQLDLKGFDTELAVLARRPQGANP